MQNSEHKFFTEASPSPSYFRSASYFSKKILGVMIKCPHAELTEHKFFKETSVLILHEKKSDEEQQQRVKHHRKIEQLKKLTSHFSLLTSLLTSHFSFLSSSPSLFSFSFSLLFLLLLLLTSSGVQALFQENTRSDDQMSSCRTHRAQVFQRSFCVGPSREEECRNRE
eukprot:TRINITY_DN3916_c0_g2_i4.p2 TRINITY_DN3916_c0_g2~~TRINITY_DN3916_c0_g2_i4.p2  ORF type:complete len:168 (+),score=55.37 TRINITY_DN3916_c0_g2_i4:1260-1763(+)